MAASDLEKVWYRLCFHKIRHLLQLIDMIIIVQRARPWMKST